MIQGLRNYGDKLAAAHALEWKWQQRGEPPEMPVGEGLAAISMMRAIKEALNNAARHAQATKVTVSLRFFPKAIAIVVSDDGIGLGAGTRSGRGMENMRRRVVDLGGRLRVFRGKGSRLSFMIPFETPDEIRSELASGEELATLRAK
jgi:signal transduction histidine kinase